MDDHPEVKQNLYAQFARVGKAVSAPKRLELLDLLAQAEKTVEQLAQQAHMPLGNTSAQLKELRSAGLVESRREGRHVVYRLAGKEVETFWLALRALAEARLVEVRETVRVWLNDPESLSPVEKEELLDKVRSGEVILLDVREEDEYQAGHLPGAVSIPASRLTRELDRLPPGRQVVAYCRGPYCVTSLKAVRLLRRKGYTARRLEDGVMEFRGRGWPVAVGAE
ncbi:MAG: metalloregulator ArsR/SmtB family transcription factor [Deltaproteobacteria bacterium]|nr:metalloregulator ArsR/SmtB family transcription factor [Deltaproteobacteria bacterium]